MTLFSIAGLAKSFGERRLFASVSFNLVAGERYALTGENGAGKSTLLRILAGLDAPDQGVGEYRGQSFGWQPYPDWLRREVIYVHQQPYLFHTSVADNIAYGLRAHGVPRAERERRLAEAVDWARLGHLLATPPQRLSGGEKQRVALARAHVLEPKILLLDEPTSNLDAESRAQTLALVDTFCDTGTTAVIACHDRDLIGLPRMRRLHLAGGGMSVGENGAG